MEENRNKWIIINSKEDEVPDHDVLCLDELGYTVTGKLFYDNDIEVHAWCCDCGFLKWYRIIAYTELPELTDELQEIVAKNKEALEIHDDECEVEVEVLTNE